MSISVRPVHIELFPFNFVFSRVLLATTCAVIKLQKVFTMFVMVLPQIDDAPCTCTLYLCSLVKGLQPVFFFLFSFFFFFLFARIISYQALNTK